MTQRRTVVLMDDLDGGPADETVIISLDGRSYELDLSTEHADALRTALARFRDAARVLPTRRRETPGVAEHNDAIRRWAIAHGHQISGRGRIPTRIREAYEDQTS